MLDPLLTKALFTILGYGVGGMLVGVVLRFLTRNEKGPRLDQSAAVGFLIGIAWGAIVVAFQLMTRSL